MSIDDYFTCRNLITNATETPKTEYSINKRHTENVMKRTVILISVYKKGVNLVTT